METKQIEVTPELASQWLSKHYKRIEEGKIKNRNINKSLVEKYKADFLNKNWQETPVPIIFDEDGDLIDGQHRLEAIRTSGVTHTFPVATGWPKDIIHCLDIGKTRSVANHLQIQGYKNANNYASCVTALGRLMWGTSCNISAPAAIYILDEIGLRNNINAIFSKALVKKDFIGWIVGTLAFYHTIKPQKALKFAEDFFTGSAEKGSAVTTFVRWLKQSNYHGTDLKIQALCACLKAWDENKELERVKLSVDNCHWLSALNYKLRDQIKKLAPRTK